MPQLTRAQAFEVMRRLFPGLALQEEDYSLFRVTYKARGHSHDLRMWLPRFATDMESLLRWRLNLSADARILAIERTTPTEEHAALIASGQPED